MATISLAGQTHAGRTESGPRDYIYMDRFHSI